MINVETAISIAGHDSIFTSDVLCCCWRYQNNSLLPRLVAYWPSSLKAGTFQQHLAQNKLLAACLFAEILVTHACRKIWNKPINGLKYRRTRNSAMT